MVYKLYISLCEAVHVQVVKLYYNPNQATQYLFVTATGTKECRNSKLIYYLHFAQEGSVANI